MINMIKVGITGVGGRVGSIIAELVSKTEDIKLFACLEKKGHAIVGREVGGCKVTDNIKDGVSGVDVLVDFTMPEATLSNLKAVVDAGKAVVIGTTGFKENELKEIDNAAKKIPIVLSSNYSVGVNVMWKLAREATKIMKQDYDIDIIEAHHRMKKDAPSGTAMTAAKIILEEKNGDLNRDIVFGRQGRDNERPRSQVGMLSVRAGGIVGEHTIIFGSMGDKLEISHTAFSRETFAEGALKAVRFIAGKKPGLYSMSDVLGI
jgi:4-hydroxy-tetrahydrodipicolinate reductase